MDRKAPSLRDLTRDERLLLMRCVCEFAWADARVEPQERRLVSRLVRRLGLAAEEVEQVETWLETPLDPGAVDPERVPRTHRALFVRALESVVTADGEVTPAEREALIRFARLAR